MENNAEEINMQSIDKKEKEKINEKKNEKFKKKKKKYGIIDRIINKMPEMHLYSYHFLGPGLYACNNTSCMLFTKISLYRN